MSAAPAPRRSSKAAGAASAASSAARISRSSWSWSAISGSREPGRRDGATDRTTRLGVGGLEHAGQQLVAGLRSRARGCRSRSRSTSNSSKAASPPRGPIRGWRRATTRSMLEACALSPKRPTRLLGGASADAVVAARVRPAADSALRAAELRPIAAARRNFGGCAAARPVSAGRRDKIGGVEHGGCPPSESPAPPRLLMAPSSLLEPPESPPHALFFFFSPNSRSPRLPRCTRSGRF